MHPDETLDPLGHATVEREGELACIDAAGDKSPCEGEVAMRWPGYGEKFWPRCRRHGEDRLRLQEEIDQRYPAHQPPDFDPLDAGERWDEDDY